MIGQKLGHYHIVEKIGAGGMGEVYRARDPRLDRDVAIKVLPPALANDQERIQRFEREARLLASLNHPNIEHVHGFEESAGTRFLVLELVEGETLGERLQLGALPVEEALPVAKQIAEAVEYAHEQGILHRDLKPANIKLTPEGKVKVLDFGLAKAFTSDSSAPNLSGSPTISEVATRAGVMLGTAAYMSPEQARGKPLDKRADIWAFGCVLYEALTGRQAFHGETVTDSLAVILKAEPDWNALPPSTPQAIKTLLRRCLQKDPTRRLRDVGDARIEIEEALSAPGVTTPPSSIAAMPLWRRILPWGLAGVFALLALFAYWQWQGAGRSPDLARRFKVVTTFKGVEVQPSLSPDGRSVVFVSDRGGQSDLWMSLVAGGTLVRITNDPNLKARPRWSPDGTKIAYAKLNEEGLWDIWVVPALGGVQRKVVANATDPSWSPDGSSLAYVDLATNLIWICDATGANPRQATPPEKSFVSHRQPAISRDGQRIAFVRRRGGGGPYAEIAVLDLASGIVRTLTNDGALSLSPAWSTDGSFVYFSSSRGGSMNIWRIASRGGQPEQVTAGQGDDVDPDVSADGQRVAYSTFRVNIDLAEISLDSRTEQSPKWLTTDSARMEVAPAYSPDGTRIAYFTARKGADSEFIWVMKADGTGLEQVAGDDSGLTVFPRWTRDGKGLVYVARQRGLTAKSQVRRIALDGSAPEILTAPEVWDNSGDVGPGGRLLFASIGSEVHLFDPANRATQKLENLRGIVPRWSPDGQLFAYLVTARQRGDANAGLWLDELGKPPRQIFRGWVNWFSWVGPGEMIVAAGKPDLTAELWRVRLDGGRALRTGTTRLLAPYWAPFPVLRFDAHPDGKRIVMEAFELQEADISLIENIR
jgi:serine/threonine protein kinase/Tol biopolymer transport system component